MNIRKIAIDVIDDVMVKRSFSNIALRNKLNSVEIDDRDKALITEIVYGTIKYLYTIDKIIGKLISMPFSKIDKNILNILRVSIYQMKYLDRIPDYAVVNESVNLAKKNSIGASKFVNGVLRSYIRKKDEFSYNKDNSLESLCYNYSFEKWMVELLKKQYGFDNTVKILEGLNETGGVTVRLNSLKGDYEAIWNKLMDKGYSIEKGAVSSESIKIIKGSNVEKNELFKDGFITVQDESAMLTAHALQVESGMKVLDLCSAPGGKATHIAELMKNTGTINACDIYENKIKLIQSNAKRLGISNIETKVMDATVYDEKFESFFDRVLLDAPCSGLGIIKKKPEIKWFKSKQDIKAILDIQQKILKNAARYVKEDGILVYSTCTINVEENENMIRNFIKENENLLIEKVDFGNRSNFIYSEEGMLTILPDKDMDGFFIAKLKKKK